ncbi:MAG: hypothetical protein U5N86_12350 [Planctomycetota bacterium]|nr:hypothetical protein [Planctomycetota bacterium]
MRNLLLTVSLMLAALLAGCVGDVYIEAPVVCQYTGKKSVYVRKLPPGSPYSEDFTRSARSVLEGELDLGRRNIRIMAVAYLLDVTDGANTGEGRLSPQYPGERHFWSPVAYFTYSPSTRCYSVAGLASPLFCDSGGDTDGDHVWRKVPYEVWRSSALTFLARAR